MAHSSEPLEPRRRDDDIESSALPIELVRQLVTDSETQHVIDEIEAARLQGRG